MRTPPSYPLAAEEGEGDLETDGSFDKVASGSYFVSMLAVGLKALKNKLSEYVRLASAGETILISDHDRVVAELVPPGHTRGHTIADAVLADAVRSGHLTPAVLPSGSPPEALAVGSLDEILGQLADDRGDR